MRCDVRCDVPCDVPCDKFELAFPQFAGVLDWWSESGYDDDLTIFSHMAKGFYF